MPKLPKPLPPTLLEHHVTVIDRAPQNDAECTAVANLLVAMSATLEIAAKRFVREWIVMVNSKEGFPSGFFGSPHAALDPATSSWLVKGLFRDLVEAHPLNAALVVEQAMQGNREAHEALIELIAEKTDRNEPLGAVLGGYTIRALHPDIPRKRGKSAWTNLVQDTLIFYLIQRLLKFFPQLKPTRSQIGRKLQPSACSIVADVLAEMGLHRGSEKAIEKIWGRCNSVWGRCNSAVHTDMRWAKSLGLSNI